MPYPDPYANTLFYILLLLIASGTAYYASRKGRSPVTWFILGALLGFLALLILLFLPAVKNGVEKNVDTPTMTVSRPDPSIHQSFEPYTPVSPSQHPPEEDKLWYYLDQNHQQMGPVSIVALRELWNTGRLELPSYVWSEGMAQWERVDNLPGLKAALKKE